MMVWAHCPECSDNYPRVYDKRIRVEASNGVYPTHTGLERHCPDCDRVVRLSVGGPVRAVARP